MFTHILLASDGSEFALKAARTASELAKKFDAKLTILSVFNPALVTPPFVGLAEAPLDMTLAERYGEDVLDVAETRTGEVLDESGIAYTTRREQGHPVDCIIQIAEEENADLIVMGSRGLDGMQSLLLGSVSDRVLHHAHCPVLIVR